MIDKSFGKKKESRQDVIQNRALADVESYISLMKKRSPESLDPARGFLINGKEGADIIDNAKKDLRLNPEELGLYCDFLMQHVKRRVFWDESLQGKKEA